LSAAIVRGAAVIKIVPWVQRLAPVLMRSWHDG